MNGCESFCYDSYIDDILQQHMRNNIGATVSKTSRFSLF